MMEEIKYESKYCAGKLDFFILICLFRNTKNILEEYGLSFNKEENKI